MEILCLRYDIPHLSVFCVWDFKLMVLYSILICFYLIPYFEQKRSVLKLVPARKLLSMYLRFDICVFIVKKFLV